MEAWLLSHRPTRLSFSRAPAGMLITEAQPFSTSPTPFPQLQFFSGFVTSFCHSKEIQGLLFLVCKLPFFVTLTECLIRHLCGRKAYFSSHRCSPFSPKALASLTLDASLGRAHDRCCSREGEQGAQKENDLH